MIPKKYLYNDNEFEINDLIRDAHPYGGTEVVATESGEGIVEDSIENQMKTLRVVFREPTIESLAALGNELDKQGLYILASAVDDVLEKFAQESLKDIRGKFYEFTTPLEEMLAPIAEDWTNVIHGRQLRKYQENFDGLTEELGKEKPDFDFVLEYANAIADEGFLQSKWNSDLQIDDFFDTDTARGRATMNRYIKLARQLQELARSYAQRYGSGFEPGKGEAPSKAKGRGEENSAKGKGGKGLGAGGNIMARIQKLVNVCLKNQKSKTKVPVNGKKGDPATWKAIKEELKLSAPGDFSNYSELLAVLQKKCGEEGTAAKSKEKMPTESTHVRFNWGGKEIDFPIARSISGVKIGDPKAMSRAAHMFVRWLKIYGIQPPATDYKDPESLDRLATFVGTVYEAMTEGVPTDGTNITIKDKNYGTAFPRIVSYITAIQKYFASLAQRLADRAQARQDQMAGAQDIFEFLTAKWTHARPVHPFFYVLKHPQAKAALLTYMVNDLKVANQQGKMTVDDAQVINVMPSIETQTKNLVRNYGIK